MIRLRALEPEDLELLYTIENDPALWDVGTTATPYSHHTLRQHIRAMGTELTESGELRQVITLDNGRAIGLIDLTHYDGRAQRAEVSIALLREFRGQGYGLEALCRMKDYCLRYLHLHQIAAFIPATNEASLRLFAAAGYQQVATLPDWHFANGSYQNVCIYVQFL